MFVMSCKINILSSKVGVYTTKYITSNILIQKEIQLCNQDHLSTKKTKTKNKKKKNKNKNKKKTKNKKTKNKKQRQKQKQKQNVTISILQLRTSAFYETTVMCNFI